MRTTTVMRDTVSYFTFLIPNQGVIGVTIYGKNHNPAQNPMKNSKLQCFFSKSFMKIRIRKKL